MSSSAKTEKPSDKKKRDESKKGKTWRSQDLVALIVLFGGACFIRYGISITGIMRTMLVASENGFVVALNDYTDQFVQQFVLTIAGLLLLVFALAAIPNLLMSRFRFASKAVRLDFAALNPVAGFKRIFNLKTLKDGIKACLYLCAFSLAAVLFWHAHRGEILTLSRVAPMNVLLILADLAFMLVLTLLGTTLILTLADAFFEYQLYIRELKMTRDEVKREHKEQNGAPEIKQEQRRLGHELLSGEAMGNVEQSTFVLANPTHIAVGVYINLDIAPLPFISVMETDERALAVIEHARKMNIPVVQNIALARKIFKTSTRYTFISEDCLNEVADVLIWLVDIEKSRRAQYEADDARAAGSDDDAAEDATGAPPPDDDTAADATGAPLPDDDALRDAKDADSDASGTAPRDSPAQPNVST